MANEAVTSPHAMHTKLSREQITGFWGAWVGWTLDGMDSVIYALVLSSALTELLPKSGYKATPGNVGIAGSILFALFLVGWGLSLVWGPIADMFGRTHVLAATIFVYAIFTGAAALSQTVWQLGLFRLLAGIGIGGEWALVAHTSPKPGLKTAARWAPDICRLVITRAFFLFLFFFFFSGFGSQLYRWSTLWLAGRVLVRPDARHRGLCGSFRREGARAVAAKNQIENRRRPFFSAQNLPFSLHRAHGG
jgi:MFS family permease